MKLDILTLFPEMFEGPFGTSMLKKAQDDGLVGINIYNLRDWAKDKHKIVDDRPYGGGPGMVIRVDVIDRAIADLKSEIRISKSETNSKSQIPNYKQSQNSNYQNSKQNNTSTDHRSQVILLSAKGKRYDQKKAQELAKYKHLILVAGHYEGVDHRVHEHLADEVISIGDYILTGGEIPAMVLVDSVTRLIPGVLNPDSLKEESHSLPATRNSLPTTEYPQYTRPEEYKGWKVPKVLLSGNHKEIDKWRKEKS
jgi:tRNA (guanine37-N1)-methyltransferase